MAALVVALLILGEVVTIYGGFWLALEVGREVHWLAGSAVLLAMVPVSIWLGHRIIKAFIR